MRDTVIVFARAPRLGTVKRRLACVLGDRTALRLYDAMLAAVLRRLAADRRFRTIVAATPDRATGSWRRGLPTIGQGRGTLEHRMGAAFRRFPHGRVAIVGSDIPELTADDVAESFQALGRAQAAFARRRLLAGGDGAASAGDAVRERQVVHPLGAGRYVGELRRPANGDAAHPVGRGHARRRARH